MSRDSENMELLVRELTLELRASEARFRNIVDNNPLGFLVVDKSEVVQFANPAAGKLLEQNLNELLGTALEFSIIPCKAFEHRVTCKNGETRLLEVHGFQTRWEERPAKGATLRDITGP
ncbi:MAG: PAS domain S-box protein [Nitrospinales bacterium]